MHCPICDVELARRTLNRVEIHYCPNCSGLLLERGTLDRIAAPHEGNLEYSTLDHETFAHPDVHGPVSCPRCPEATMAKVEFNVYSGIILDYCEACGAFWLDGRELGRINKEIQELDEAPKEAVVPGMQWFAQFLWSLPR